MTITPRSFTTRSAPVREGRGRLLTPPLTYQTVLTAATAPPSKSAVVVLRELDAFGFGVEAFEHLLNQSGLDAAVLARLDEVAHRGVYPRVLVDAEDDRRVLAHFEFVDGRLREQLAVDAYALAHRLADHLARHRLHRPA